MRKDTRMNRTFQRSVILTVAFSLVVLLTAGCQEETTPGPRKAMLLTDQIRQLNGQLAQRDKELTKQKKLLEKCKQEKIESLKKAKDSTSSLVDFIMEQNKILMQENGELKSQLEQLKK